MVSFTICYKVVVDIVEQLKMHQDIVDFLKYKLPSYKFIPWNNMSMWQWFNVWVLCWNPLYTVWLWQKKKTVFNQFKWSFTDFWSEFCMSPRPWRILRICFRRCPNDLQSFAVRISPQTGVHQKCSSVTVRLWFGVCFLFKGFIAVCGFTTL